MFLISPKESSLYFHLQLIQLNFALKTPTESSFREARVYLTYTCYSPSLGKSGRSSRQGPRAKKEKQKPRKSSAYWLAPFGACSAFFLIQPSTHYPGVTMPTVSWTFLNQLTSKIMYHTHAHASPIEVIPSLRLPQVTLGSVKLITEAQ